MESQVIEQTSQSRKIDRKKPAASPQAINNILLKKGVDYYYRRVILIAYYRNITIRLQKRKRSRAFILSYQ